MMCRAGVTVKLEIYYSDDNTDINDTIRNIETSDAMDIVSHGVTGSTESIKVDFIHRVPIKKKEDKV